MDEEALSRLRHDLRSPLTVIGGFASLLAGDRELTDEQRRDYARHIEAACEEMRRIVDELDGA